MKRSLENAFTIAKGRQSLYRMRETPTNAKKSSTSEQKLFIVALSILSNSNNKTLNLDLGASQDLALCRHWFTEFEGLKFPEYSYLGGDSSQQRMRNGDTSSKK